MSNGGDLFKTCFQFSFNNKLWTTFLLVMPGLVIPSLNLIIMNRYHSDKTRSDTKIFTENWTKCLFCVFKVLVSLAEDFHKIFWHKVGSLLTAVVPLQVFHCKNIKGCFQVVSRESVQQISKHNLWRQTKNVCVTQ